MNNSTIRKALVTLVAGAALVAGGCGGDRSPEASVSDLYAAAADGDAAKVCSLMTEAAAQHAADDEDAATCEEGVTKSLGGGAGALLGQIEVGDADVDGDSGTVDISFAGQSDTVNVVHEDGEWKVDEDQ